MQVRESAFTHSPISGEQPKAKKGRVKDADKRRHRPGPKPSVLKIDGNWQDAVKKSLAKKKPPGGWPK